MNTLDLTKLIVNFVFGIIILYIGIKSFEKIKKENKVTYNENLKYKYILKIALPNDILEFDLYSNNGKHNIESFIWNCQYIMRDNKKIRIQVKNGFIDINNKDIQYISLHREK